VGAAGGCQGAVGKGRGCRREALSGSLFCVLCALGVREKKVGGRRREEKREKRKEEGKEKKKRKKGKNFQTWKFLKKIKYNL
jgi:hypothetical protein